MMQFSHNPDITSVADHVSDPIFILDITGRITYANTSASCVLGFPKQELKGREIASVLYPAEQEWLRSVCDGQHHSASHWLSAHTKLLASDGRCVSCDLDYCVRNQPDMSYDILVIAHTTPERPLTGSDTDTPGDLLPTVFDTMLDGIAIVSETGAVLYANKAAREIAGIPESYNLKDLNIASFLDDASWKKGSEGLMQIIHGGFVRINEYRLQEMAAPAEWIEAIGTRIFFGGKPSGLLSFRDITERKRAEKEIKLAEERYATIVNEAPEPIIVHTQGIVTFVNDTALHISGYNRDEIIGHHVFDRLTESSRIQALEAMKAREDGHPIREYEVDFITKSGDILHLLVKNTVIVYDKEVHVLLFLSDITERKRLEEALIEANRKRNLLNRITRHDLANKIASLEAYCLMTKNDPLSPEARHRLSLLEQTTMMIKQHVEFSRTYQYLGIRDPTWTDISLVIQECIKTIEGLPCTPVCDTGHVLLYTDPLIKQVIFNILENSIRHGGTVSMISFSWHEDGKDGIVCYCDNGTGVAADEKEKIFAEGYGKDMGFGLFLAREILAVTGLTIRETGKQGSGARFEIRVPAGKFKYP